MRNVVLMGFLALALGVISYPSNSHGMGIPEFSEKLALAHSIEPETAETYVKAVFDQLAVELKSGEPITIRNFGRFYLSNRQARVGRNPRTGEAINIPAKRYPRFSSAEGLKKSMNETLAETPQPIAPNAQLNAQPSAQAEVAAEMVQ